MNNPLTITDYPFFEDEKKIEIRELTIKNGLSFPTDEELIMLILGSGTKKTPIKELAHQIFETVLSSNRENLIENLMKINGVGQSKALMVASALEFGKRLNRNPQSYFHTPADVIPFIQNYAMQNQEHFLCISLNGAREILSIRVISTGASNMAIVEPREVFCEAIKEHASAIILSHNHPSGNTSPSFEDVKITLRLAKAADILGIKLLDHIIISRTNYFSFYENKFMDMDSMLVTLEKYAVLCEETDRKLHRENSMSV